jgi:hypothetical protein
MRVVGIDIGIRNLAICALEISTTSLAVDGNGTGGGVITEAKNAVSKAKRIEWVFGELCDAKQNANRCSHTSILDRMVIFVREQSFLLCEWPDCVVIEAQPAARMKMLGGALYALIRRTSPDLKIVIQAARKKLVWCPNELDATVPIARKQTTYTDRKKAAVALCAYIISETEGRGEAAICANAAFHTNRKKDDAADSFLHALHFAVYGERGGPVVIPFPKATAKRRRVTPKRTLP